VAGAANWRIKHVELARCHLGSEMPGWTTTTLNSVRTWRASPENNFSRATSPALKRESHDPSANPRQRSTAMPERRLA